MTNRIESGWNFDNSYAHLPKSFFTKLNPNPVQSPKLIILNDSLATSLGLDVQALQSEEGVAVLAGNQIPKALCRLLKLMRGINLGILRC